MAFLTRLLAKAMPRWRAFAWPSQCQVCRLWPADRICEDCIRCFAQPGGRCSRCAIAVPAGVTVCGQCLRTPPAFDAGLAAVDYAFPWADLVTALKFRNDPGLAVPLGQLLRHAPWVEPALEAADRVVPIPLSPARLRERGYNQAALLASALAPDKTDAHTLLRMRDATAQSQLSREARQHNLDQAFMLDPLRAPALRGQRIVLLDDVMTTGTTLNAASQVLREAGVAHITALVLARTPAP